MKKSRRLLALLLAVVMVFAMSTTALAASITINGGADGETYTAYKIFDVSISEDGTNYSYTIDGTSDWFDFFETYETYGEEDEETGVITYTVGSYGTITLTPVSGTTTYNVSATVNEGYDDEFAEYLADALAAYAESANINADAEITYSSATTDEDGTVTGATTSLTVSGDGYYLVVSSLGTKLMLNTVTDGDSITEKNEEPTVEKTVSPDDDKDDNADVSIGDTVTFTITVNAKAGALNYVVTDTMSKGLTYADSLTVVEKASDEDDTDETLTAYSTENSTDYDYTLSVTTNEETGVTTITITFSQTYLDSISSATEIVITYSATLNKDAVVDSDGNTNEVYLEYGENSTESETYKVTVDTHDLTLEKVDENDESLDGATFTLQYTTKDEDGETVAGSYVYFDVAEGTNYDTYTVSSTSTTYEIEIGSAYIKGLEAGTYTLTETKAPSGYNILTSSIVITIDEEGNIKIDSGTGTLSSDTLTIQNATGSELPSTGGMGTTVLYIVGACLVLGAAVLLVTRRRMSRG